MTTVINQMDFVVSTEVFTFTEHAQTTPEGPFQDTLTGHFKEFLVASGVIINLFGVLSSALILVIIYKDRSLRKPYNALIGSMAVTDMVGCGVVNLTQAAGIHYEKFPITWPSADVMAKVHLILSIQLNFAVILHAMAISIIRYRLVIHPVTSARIINKFTVGILILILHVVSCILVGSKFTSQLTFVKVMGISVDVIDDNISRIVMATVLVLAAVVILYCYIRIHRTVYLAKNKIQTVIMERNQRNQAKRNLKRNSSHKYILLCMVTICVLLIIGHVPVFVAFWKMKSGASMSVYILPMTNMIIWISNAVHSLVYGVLDTNFRKSFKVLISNRATVSPDNTTLTIKDWAESE